MELLIENFQSAHLSLCDQVYIVTNSDELKIAEKSLQNLNILAFDCEGVDLGRSGSVCVVQISSREKCFLFDVLNKSKEDPIIQFLKSILENHTITKIIHDCRMDSDALYYHYDINLCNCHDTQAWDIELYSRNRGHNLNQTLLVNNCAANEDRDTLVYYANNAFWATRPMTKMMISWASSDVTSLFELYDKQLAVATDEQVEVCKRRCETNEDYLRVCIAQTMSVRNMGKLIGPKGSNLQMMQERVPGSFVKSIGRKGEGMICVYAPHEKAMTRLMDLLRPYKC